MAAYHILTFIGLLIPVALSAPCNVPNWLEGRVSGVPEKNGTLLDYIEQSSDVVDAVRNVTSFLEKLDKRIDDFDEVLGIPRICFTNEKGLNSVDAISQYYGFGKVSRCLTKIHYASSEEELREQKSDEIHRASLVLLEESVKAGKRLKEDGYLGWDKVESNRFFVGSSETKFCNLVKSSGHRINGRWIPTASIFNLDPKKYEEQEAERNIYLQMLYIDETKSKTNITSFPLSLTQCTDGEEDGRKSYPAIISKWEGKPSWSDFISVELAKNPSIRGGLRDGEISADMFQEVDSPADVAIFLLPVVMALLPAAMFNNVRNLATLFVYILLDLIAAVPIALKSFELLLKSRETKKFTELYYYGSNNVSESAAAEVFVANCGLTDRFVRIGRDLLIMACVLTVASVILDIWFFISLKKKKKQYSKAVEEGGGLNSDSPEYVTSSPGSDLMWYWSYNRKNK